MSIWQALLLGALQGATEFLPVSSSGHLVLVPWLLGWPSPGLDFDTFVHWGTAVAVIVYFRRDWFDLLRASILALRRGLRGIRFGSRVDRDVDLAVAAATESAEGRLMAPYDGAGPDAEIGPSRSMQDSRMVWFILLGTVPAAVLGYLLEDFFEGMFARPALASAFLLVTASVLAASERWGSPERDLDQLTWRDALIVGLGQALAIFPGISRSGATIAAGIGRGLRRAAAARFSFLLATPIILGAGMFKLLGLADTGRLAAQAPTLISGFLTAGIVGYACVHFLMRFLQDRPLYPFAIYCAIAGAAGLSVAIAGGA